MKLKSQVSVFVILALLILAVLVFASVLTREAIDVTEVRELFPPSEHVGFCVQKHLIPLLKDGFSRGGTFDPLPTLYSQDIYTIRTDDVFVRPFDSSAFARALSVRLNEEVTTCFNLTSYIDQGWDVEFTGFTTNVSFSGRFTRVELDTTLRIVRGSTSYTLDTLSFSYDLPVALIFSSANSALSSYASDTWFDIVQEETALQLKGAGTSIKREQVYPHTLYEYTHLKYNLTLRFALQGVSTLSSARPSISPAFVSSACLVDGVCVAGVACDASEACQPLSQTAVSPTGACSQNGLAFAQSKCISETGVGGRWGIEGCTPLGVKKEWCRDFKEEVCVQEGSNAVCVPNTGYMCQDCTSETCCTQACVWLGDSCSARTPLGSAFWQENTRCYSGSKVNSTLSCMLSSDCSFVPTVHGDVSGSYDLYKLYSNITNTKISHMPQVQSRSVTTSSTLSLTRFINENIASFTSGTAGTNQGVSYCSQFIAFGESCEFCEQSGRCSEYLCRSLGACYYDPLTRICDATSSKPVPLEFSEVTMSKPFESHEPLYVIEDEVELFEQVQVNFSTSEPALCKPSLFSHTPFIQLQAPDVSSGTFSTNHSVLFSFVKPFTLIETLFTRFNSSSTAELAANFRLLRHALTLNDISVYSSAFYVLVDGFVEATLDARSNTLALQALEQAKSNSLSFFVRCITSTGRESDSVFGVSFSLSSSCSSVPLKVHGQTIENNGSLRLYLNKPSQCTSSESTFVCDDALTDMYGGSFVCQSATSVTSQVTCVYETPIMVDVQASSNGTTYWNKTTAFVNQSPASVTLPSGLSCDSFTCDAGVCNASVTVGESFTCDACPSESLDYMPVRKSDDELSISAFSVQNGIMRVTLVGSQIPTCTLQERGAIRELVVSEVDGQFVVTPTPVARGQARLVCQNGARVERIFIVD